MYEVDILKYIRIRIKRRWKSFIWIFTKEAKEYCKYGIIYSIGYELRCMVLHILHPFILGDWKSYKMHIWIDIVFSGCVIKK